MTFKKTTEIKVGIVSLLAIAIFIIGITLGKGVNVSVDKKTLRFRFDNSGGITEGSPVVINGVKRGQVESVENQEGSVLILVEMNDISDIKTDASAKITILEITGGKKIELNPGGSAQLFNPKNEIPGRATPDIGDLVATLGEVSGNAISLVRNLDTLALGVNKMMDNGRLAEDLTTIAQNTAELTTNMNVLLKDNYIMLDKTIKNLNSLVADIKKTYNKNEPNIDKLFVQLDTALSNANSLLSKIDKTMENADLALSDVKDITSEIKQGSGLANKLIYDKSIAQSLDSALNSLNILVNKINEHGVNVNVRLGTRP